MQCKEQRSVTEGQSGWTDFSISIAHFRCEWNCTSFHLPFAIPSLQYVYECVTMMMTILFLRSVLCFYWDSDIHTRHWTIDNFRILSRERQNIWNSFFNFSVCWRCTQCRNQNICIWQCPLTGHSAPCTMVYEKWESKTLIFEYVRY